MDTSNTPFGKPPRRVSEIGGFVSAESERKSPKRKTGSWQNPLKRWKKPLLIAAGVASTLIIAVIVYVFVLLSQVNYVPLDEPAKMAAADQEMPNAEVIAEQKINDDLAAEVSMSDIQQTQLTQAELDALAEQEKLSNVTNILLLGVDTRGSGAGGNADTIMIASIDRNNKKLKLTSLMRDMFVSIPDVGENRINAAMSKGGVAKLIETVNTNFLLNIDKYVLVDFRMFEKIVDKLGGITMTLSAGEVSAANDCIAGLNKQRGVEDFRKGFITRSGEVRLTGQQALGYARIRHYNGGDYARTNRQYKVLKIIFQKFLGKDFLSQQQMLFDLLPMVATNLTELEIADLAVAALQSDTDQLLHYRLPAEGFFQSRNVRGMSVLVPDIQANAKALHDFIFDAVTQPDLPEMNIKEKGGAYVAPDFSATPTPEFPDPLDPQQSQQPQQTADQPTAQPAATPEPAPAPTPTPTAQSVMPMPASSTPQPTLMPY